MDRRDLSNEMLSLMEMGSCLKSGTLFRNRSNMSGLAVSSLPWVGGVGDPLESVKRGQQQVAGPTLLDSLGELLLGV